jgi:hypothetical protein
MKLTISTPSFGPLKVALARPFDLAIELTKIRYGGRTVLIGFQFRRGAPDKLDDWRLWDFVCKPVRGEISDELVNEIRRVGKREIGAWINANPEAIYRQQRVEIIKSLPEFRQDVRQLLEQLYYAVERPLVEQQVWQSFRPDGRHLLACENPRWGLKVQLWLVAQTLRKVLDISRPETFAAA